MTDTHTESLRTEAALCLWEEIVTKDYHGPAEAPWEPYRERHGTVTLRHDVMALAPTLLDHWDALTEEEREALIPYDWEFCPRWLTLALDWETDGPAVRADAVERLKEAARIEDQRHTAAAALATMKRELEPITLMDDQPPTCGICGRRVELAATPCGRDEDGNIYEGTCAEHGTSRYQDQPETADDD